MDSAPLIPEAISARAAPHGRFAAAFGVRFFAALALGLLWVIPAWWFRPFIGGMFLWDFAILAAWYFDLRRLPECDDIEVTRRWPLVPSLAAELQVSIEIHNCGTTPIHAEIVDDTPAALRLAPPALAATVKPGRAAIVEYSVCPRQRGDLAMGPVYLRYRSPLGLAERWAVASIGQPLRVLPDIHQARSHALYLIRSRQVEMERRRKRQRGSGREFEALRDYRQGDEMRDICWPATARRNHPITRVYQVERSQAVWIVLDAGRLMRAQVDDPTRDFRSAKLDYAVDAALALAQVASQTGDRVGLLAYGRSVQQALNVGRGAHHMRAMVEALARVRAETAEADHSLAVRTLLQRQTRRALVIWVTDFPETPSTPDVIEYAMRLTSRHIVVFAALTQPDLLTLARTAPRTEDQMFRHAVALEVSARREALLRGLRERGVLAVDVGPRATAAALIDRYLEVKERGRL